VKCEPKHEFQTQNESLKFVKVTFDFTKDDENCTFPQRGFSRLLLGK
jgi:hypothetical protein